MCLKKFKGLPEKKEEKLIKNKIANALHYYKNTKEDTDKAIEETVNNLYCLFTQVSDDCRIYIAKMQETKKKLLDECCECLIHTEIDKRGYCKRCEKPIGEYKGVAKMLDEERIRDILEELIRKNYRQAGQKPVYSYYEVDQAIVAICKKLKGDKK